ncbi:MAG: class I SAM-dependent methyltransferase family protein [Candidatus Bathyarchaeia archaeon]
MKKKLKMLLAEVLSPDELQSVCNSYDIVGDIAIIRVSEEAKMFCKTVAEAIIAVHKNVKTVLAQTSPVTGDFRLRKLEHVAGENKTVTVHRESECLFSVDVEKCYFSPRLFFERMRIARLVENNEVVVNMFGGVGCFSIIIAKHSNAQKVYSIDVNRAAVQYLEDNVRLNRVYGKVIPLLGDAKEVIETRLRHIANRVLMPLPEKALEYLPYALSTLKKTGGWIHFYYFEHAKKNENPIEKVKAKVAEKLEHLGAAFEIPFGRVVRTTGPNWYQIVLDIKIVQRI